jgi:hypothetical protein
MNEVITPLMLILMGCSLFLGACLMIFWVDTLIALFIERKPTRFLILLCIPPVGFLIEARKKYQKWLKKTYLTPKYHMKKIWESAVQFWRSLDWRL